MLLCSAGICLFQMDEIREDPEVKHFLRNYDSGIIEASINYQPGRLTCRSNKYKFEINTNEFIATNIRTDFQEFRYLDNILMKKSEDPVLLDSISAINNFLSEYNALDLTEIIENSIYSMETGESRFFNND